MPNECLEHRGARDGMWLGTGRPARAVGPRRPWTAGRRHTAAAEQREWGRNSDSEPGAWGVGLCGRPWEVRRERAYPGGLALQGHGGMFNIQ